jgi:hypothetical protein
MRQSAMNQTQHSGMGRVGKLALVAVAIPVATRVLRRVGHQMQERRSHPHMGGMMHRGASASYGRHGRW